VLDYIFVNDRVEVHDGWLAFDRPGVGDPTLYPSDHFGLAATLTLRP
jgi:endonuclease/exonuclease/phosphatase family metal-dependent hydrolase